MKVYCPRCGQEQVSSETRFCSRCGFLMTGLAEVIFAGGLNQQLETTGAKPVSPRRRGLKQGGAWFLLGIFIVTILAVLQEMFRFNDNFVALAAVIFFLGGILRMIYALFESGNPADKTLEENVMQTAQKLLNKKPQANALPPQQSIPASNYVPPVAGNWRDTNDLVQPSVTESTTKLLTNEEKT
ncbi:hypothetical protein BH10ACI1_BH10ACI1_07270 [soil metagenome]